MSGARAGGHSATFNLARRRWLIAGVFGFGGAASAAAGVAATPSRRPDRPLPPPPEVGLGEPHRGALGGAPLIGATAAWGLALAMELSEFRLPVVVALNMRVMRSGIIEELSKDYVLTARAKGADRRTIHYKHARRNALLPVITVAGQLVAMSMEGSIAVEVVYNRQGIGWWLAESATQLDMPVLMCICLFMGLVFVVTNLTIDILYATIDPRIRLN